MKAWQFVWIGLLLALGTPSQAQELPVAVQTAGNSALLRVGSPASPLAEIKLDFDQVSGLSAAALGVRAELVLPSDAALLARLPDAAAVSLPSSLPLLLTIEPPATLGLDLRRRVHVELHTHALVYQAGSRYRLFKAALGGPFRDISTAVLPGSVRTRGSTGSFSQFLVLLDLRSTDAVVAEKLAWTRDQAAALTGSLRSEVLAALDEVESAVAAGEFAQAALALDAARAAVAAQAGSGVPDRWLAGGSLHNLAGELISGFDTLSFSIGVLRDFGP
jgi:hypothetical protein